MVKKRHCHTEAERTSPVVMISCRGWLGSISAAALRMAAAIVVKSPL